jgi:hypothetical protein
MKTLNDINFPILEFFSDGKQVYASVIKQEYLFSNQATLSKGLLRNSFVVDSNGKKYNIKSFKKKIKYFDLFTLIVNPDYKIYINFSEPEQLSIDEIKLIVIDGFKHVGVKKKKVYSGIQSAENVTEMVKIIVKEYNRQIEFNDEDNC